MAGIPPSTQDWAPWKRSISTRDSESAGRTASDTRVVAGAGSQKTVAASSRSLRPGKKRPGKNCDTGHCWTFARVTIFPLSRALPSSSGVRDDVTFPVSKSHSCAPCHGRTGSRPARRRGINRLPLSSSMARWPQLVLKHAMSDALEFSFSRLAGGLPAGTSLKRDVSPHSFKQPSIIRNCRENPSESRYLQCHSILRLLNPGFPKS